MKRSSIAVAALGMVAGVAHAQSSVTLYGIIDTGVAFTNNSQGGQLYTAAQSTIQGSRWGFRGAEDLGGGLHAVFVLENGFNPATGKLGQGGDMFGRQAFVGIKSDSLGTVTLGRQYDSSCDYVGPFEVGNQWAMVYGAHPGDLDNLNLSNRVNNSVKYTSPSYGGFSFGGLYSVGGVAGQFAQNQIWSVGAGYNDGPMKLGVAYINLRNPNFSFFGNTPASSATGNNMSSSQVYSGFASAESMEVISAGGAYTLGAATIGATYSNTQFKGLGQTVVAGLPSGSPLSGTAKFNNAELSIGYKLSPALLIGIAYDYTKGYSVSNETIHQGMIGADYFLSARTDVYAAGVFQHALGENSIGQPATAQFNGSAPSSTQNQIIAAVGIRHKF